VFEKILIANRGEIACRVMRTCRRLGIATVAVFSEADADSLHVRLADEAFGVGPAPSRDSYLNIERVIAAARDSGAQAIHPGYGFLSENAAFAAACLGAGIVFIGPPVAAIRAMGSKSAAKMLMEQAAVPLVPGYHGGDQNADLLQRQADKIGYPVLIKASAGGGGKGMRVVDGRADFSAALISCQREALAGFGNDQVLLEKYLVHPRHVEIQIFGDTQGHVVSLYERDCSAQRRHQKVVEEAPAPGMSAERRAAMGEAACKAARAVGYVGAGTVEFIVDVSGAFYFMEMNTRLQVEHPVTEMITGLDLVEWQLGVAAGQPLPLTQEQILLHGHAIEARVYAEEPEKGFLPSIGRLSHFVPPAATGHVRIDSGVEQGDQISPHYDPMIAKLIVWDKTRELARAHMLQALGNFQIAGVGNNLAFLSRLIDHPVFREGRLDTGLIERERDVLLVSSTGEIAVAAQIAALRNVADEARQASILARGAPDPYSAWSQTDGWRVNGTYTRRLVFQGGERLATVEVSYLPTGRLVNGEPAAIISDEGTSLRYRLGDRVGAATVVRLRDQFHVFHRGHHYPLTLADPMAYATEDVQHAGSLTAPMPGKIVALPTPVGALVEKGAALLVMEAMKMEHTLRAPEKGTVRAYLCEVGEQVDEGVALVDFDSSTPSSA
jgi:3-methylcrotonyl-CoA carboxylase alpha subunit